MELLPEWAPNIHPMLVHFPIALLVVAAGMNLLTFFIPEKWWNEWKNTILYGLGAITAIIVYFTGQSAADSVFLPAEAQSVLNHHADWALWTVWYFGLYALARLALHWYEMMSKFSLRILAFAIALPGLFLLYETGDHGAKMVFGYGAGTGQLLEQKQESTSVSADSLVADTGTTFAVQDNGNWSWPMGLNTVSALLENFHWLEGTAQNLQPATVKSGDNYLLKLSGKSLNSFFTVHDSFQNVQIDYYLDLSNFDGEVELVNHVQDVGNYDFVTLSSDGTISQGRVTNGNRKVFGKESYSASGMLFVRTVVNGTHFRAYINEQMAVHGHGDAPEAGSVGLRLNGSGTVTIDRISLTQLN